MTLDDFEVEKIMAAVTVGLILMACLGAAYYEWTSIKEKPYRAQCEDNPRLRYANNCTTANDCMDKCIARLQHGVS